MFQKLLSFLCCCFGPCFSWRFSKYSLKNRGVFDWIQYLVLDLLVDVCRLFRLARARSLLGRWVWSWILSFFKAHQFKMVWILLAADWWTDFLRFLWDLLYFPQNPPPPPPFCFAVCVLWGWKWKEVMKLIFCCRLVFWFILPTPLWMCFVLHEELKWVQVGEKAVVVFDLFLLVDLDAWATCIWLLSWILMYGGCQFYFDRKR